MIKIISSKISRKFTLKINSPNNFLILFGIELCPYSFLCGDPGPLALAAVLAYRSGDRQQCSKHVKALLDLSTHVRYRLSCAVLPCYFRLCPIS